MLHIVVKSKKDPKGYSYVALKKEDVREIKVQNCNIYICTKENTYIIFASTPEAKKLYFLQILNELEEETRIIGAMPLKLEDLFKEKKKFFPKVRQRLSCFLEKLNF